jgi:hypothetical protein
MFSQLFCGPNIFIDRAGSDPRADLMLIAFIALISPPNTSNYFTFLKIDKTFQNKEKKENVTFKAFYFKI